MNETRLACSFLHVNLEKSRYILIANIIACILNAMFSLMTVTGNFIILLAIRKTRELHSPSFFLLGCLAFSDLVVGLVCQTSFMAYVIAELGENFNAYCTLRLIHVISGWITTGASYLTLAAVSIDRFLALTLHLRYNMIVTVPRVFIVVCVLWITCITGVLLRFWLSNWITYALGVMILTFFVTALSALKIFQIVRRHLRQIHGQNTAGNLPTNTVNAIKCRKSAVTVLYVHGLQLVFYLPICVTMFVETFGGYNRPVKIAFIFSATAVCINSCLNPLVYCWRSREIRLAVRGVLRKI